MSQVPDSRGRVLRVEEEREIEAAITVSKSTKVVVRFRPDLGSLEERQWRRSGELLDSDHDGKRRDRGCPRPYASHPQSRFLRSVARTGEKDVGFVSELLKAFNASIMRSYAMSTRVNQVVNEDKESSAPVHPVQTQNQLRF